MRTGIHSVFHSPLHIALGFALLLASNALQAQYLESFNIPNKGYLLNFESSFTGVNWTMSSWSNTDPNGLAGRDADDYFYTTSDGKLLGLDFDQNLCWISPTITVPTSGVNFSVQIAWTQFDRENISDVASDFIDVEYSINGGANWERLPTTVGLGLSKHTVCYRNNNGGGQNSGPSNNNGSSTFAAAAPFACPNGTLILRICTQMNDNPNETITIDNVSVPLGSLGGCTAPTLSTTVRNVSCNGGNTGQIDLTVSGGGTPPYTYAWTGGASGQDPTGLAVGTYTVTVTDNLNCSATTSATIGFAPAIATSTAISPNTCAGVADGGVDLTVNGGVPPFTYAWTGGAATQDLDNVVAGTYTVTITDAPGCTATTSVVIGTSGSGAYLEEFNVSGQGYLPDFENNFSGVNWTLSNWPLTVGPPTNIIGRENDDYFRTSGGSLTAVDVDANVCWTSPVLDINPPANGITFSVNLSWTGFDKEGISNTASDYIDVEYSLNGGAWTRIGNQLSGLSGHTISYPNSAPANDNNGSLVVTSPTLSGNTLQIRVCTEINGDEEFVNINSVSANSSSFYCPAPEANAGNDRTICTGQTVTLAATANNGTGVWSVTSGPSTAGSQFNNTAASNAVFTPGGGAGVYTLRWTVSANGFPDATDEMTVTVNQTPSASLTAPAQICQNVAFNLSVPDAGVGASYNWSGNGVVNTNAAATTATPTATGPQTYAVTVTASNTCSATSTASVTVLPTPNATITPSSPACDGGTLNLSVPNAGVGASYAWSGPGVVNSNSDATTAALSGTGSQTYNVTVTGSNGCVGTGSIAVMVNATPDATITPSSPICQNVAFSLSVPGAGAGASYNWSGLGISNNNNNATNAVPSAAGSQTYSVTVTSAAGCSATGSVTVTVNVPPTVDPITGGGTYCGGTSANLSVTSVGGATYTWGKYNNSTLNPQFPSIGTGNPFSVTKTGMYRVSVTSAEGCAVVSGETTVVIADNRFTDALVSSDPIQNGRLIRNATSATCAAPKTCPGVFTGSYRRRIYEVTNTRNVSVCATVGISPCADVFATGYLESYNPADLCQNYAGDPGASFAFRTGTFEVNVPANTKLIVVVCHQDDGGLSSCSYDLSIDMPRESAVLTASPDPVCQNGTLDLSVPSAGVGTTYSWSGNGINNVNANSTTATPTTAGSQTYAVTVTVPGGCTNVSSKTVTVGTLPAANFSPALPSSICQQGTLNLSVPNAGAGATYNWSGDGINNVNSNSTTAVPTNTGSQPYSVTVTSAAGCSNTATANVTVNPKPSASITPNPSPVCQNSTLNLSIPNAGGGATYTWSGNGINNANTNSTTAVPTATGTQAYAVTVNNASGCSNTGSVNVTVNPQPSAMLTASQASACGPALVNLSVPSAGAGASYNWSGNGVVNTNANTTTAAPNAGGNQTYAVTVTSPQGCTNTGSKVVNVVICVEGKIIWKTNNTSGVKDVTVTITGDLSTSVVTPVTGLYSFSTSSGSAFTITPSKALNKMNGVNAQDVQRIQQHLGALPITDPYVLAAADVNANNMISALDANIIQLAILGNPSALAQMLYSWRFVPVSHVMSNPPWGFPEKITLANAGGGQSSLDFYGIKVGDVTAINANPANSSGQPLLFRVPDQRLQAGQTISIDFTADQIAELGAFQMALRFDPAILSLSDIQSTSAAVPMTANNFGLNETGVIRMMWSDANAVALRQPSPVFRLSFKVLANGGKLSEVLGLDDSVLAGHCYNQQGVESEVSLRFYEVTGTQDPSLENADQLVLYQNQPNPFISETVIGYYLPEAAQAVFSVYDVNGKLVYRQQYNAAKGYNQAVLKDAGLPTGLLYYRVETPTASATRKMVRVE